MKPRSPIAILACIVMLLTACGKKEEEEGGPQVTVQVATVQRGPIELVVTTDAVLFPLQQAAITPKISAPVKKFYVNRGAKVKQGQLLATLESRDLEGSLAQAQANYESTTKASLPEEIQKAQLDLQAAQQALDAEQKLYDSRENLFKQGALPRKDLDQARVALVQARNQYEIAQRHLQALQAVGARSTTKAAAGQLQTAQANVSYAEIRSPIPGYVTDRPLYSGEMASAGTPLITVMDTSQIVARAHIPQAQAALLKPGDAAEIAAPGAEDKFAARITLVNPATDPNSTTVEIWAQAPNPAGRLRPGTTVQLRVIAKKVNDALTVPASALIKTPDGSPAVMVVQAEPRKNQPGSDEVAHMQPVQVGVTQDDRVQITTGLQAGQRVISSGAYGLPDKTKVNVEAPPAKSESEKTGG